MNEYAAVHCHQVLQNSNLTLNQEQKSAVPWVQPLEGHHKALKYSQVLVLHPSLQMRKSKSVMKVFFLHRLTEVITW